VGYNRIFFQKKAVSLAPNLKVWYFLGQRFFFFRFFSVFPSWNRGVNGH
jgi:hypothetical protein